MTTEPRRVIIVDDEQPARDNLRLAMQAFDRWQVVAEAADTAEARSALDEHEVDLMFVDVQMPGENGVRFARSLAGRPNPPIIVFVTAFDSFAIEAFEARALDYLLKPFDDRRLAQTLERAEQLLEWQQRAQYAGAVQDLADDQQAKDEGQAPSRIKSISVRSVRKIERVSIEDIVWIGSSGNYVELHCENRCLLHRAPMSWMEERLDPQQFLRVHRKAIVRRAAIQAVHSSEAEGVSLELSTGERIGVSARYVATVRAALDAHD
ncbi:LytR/AlgR family response regulator transcription factor [Pseudomarimonas arenosa]|uniref:Response regulator transcription factor n=1 Tax=Pseudomarimonas arenosa TaxID=2774145 RepID=A0AAW3ZN40_9GAMM|nr:LytTR family DNA-binding domain-containing protein [Pseudomarimonas arenosa]MBD8526954.1 response regulator transcription factor [Pseudomarimonas arenosa]